jgi:hypothetical protein
MLRLWERFGVDGGAVEASSPRICRRAHYPLAVRPLHPISIPQPPRAVNYLKKSMACFFSLVYSNRNLCRGAPKREGSFAPVGIMKVPIPSHLQPGALRIAKVPRRGELELWGQRTLENAQVTRKTHRLGLPCDAEALRGFLAGKRHTAGRRRCIANWRVTRIDVGRGRQERPPQS